MEVAKLQNEIEKIWNLKQKGEDFNVKKAISLANEVISLLDAGKICVVEKNNNSDDFAKNWSTNQWIKKGILLYFLNDCKLNSNNTNCWFDKCEDKFKDWSEDDFKKAKIRIVNGSYVRKGAYFDNGCIIMPSFVNIGVNVGENTMIDSMATIGSCAKIGAKCHISANVCIGGVLEPLQDNPVIIEDNCFIGAGSNIAEGIIIGEGSVIASGVTLSSGVKIINRETGTIEHGKIPPYSVVVAGSYKTTENISINCAVIVKTITKQIRQKTSINNLLR